MYLQSVKDWSGVHAVLSGGRGPVSKIAGNRIRRFPWGHPLTLLSTKHRDVLWLRCGSRDPLYPQKTLISDERRRKTEPLCVLPVPVSDFGKNQKTCFRVGNTKFGEEEPPFTDSQSHGVHRNLRVNRYWYLSTTIIPLSLHETLKKETYKLEVHGS